MDVAGMLPTPIFSFSLDNARAVVDGIPEDRRIVLLGESTHGTEEFYRIRSEITKRLIEERGFTAVVFEADWPFMEAANEFIHGRRATPFPDGPERFPSWMWHNQCMVEFFDWCKKQSPQSTPDVFGMDCYSLFESKKAVLAFLETHDREFAAEVKGRLAYLDRFESGFAYADAMVHGSLSRVASHITDCLTKIQARLQWGSDKYSCSAVERLSAEQNCEVIIAADEYYRKCVSEPPGSQASWNTRDQHMATTLLRIQDRLRDPKVIVWAHNSHIGDSTATKRGGVNFDRNETWNLGQMARATFGADKVWIVGQYTHRGAVTAAPNWGEKHANVPLNPALAQSFEGALHDLLARTATGPTLSFNTAALIGVGGAAAGHPAAGGVADLLAGPPRLQRWVGVSYKPDTELESHYGEMVLAKCYDQVVFVDVTTGLAPVAPRPQPRSDSSSVQMSRASSQRLLKEFQRMRQAPPGIEARPLDSNILEWHFVLRCSQPPYAGGEYHGRLDFPPEYPMQPPAFRVLTPSGRFEPGARLCLSMSDFHPESWNPSWSVETLLVGLQSFMYEESNAIGSIRASTEERERLALASRQFNSKNAIWRELFQSGASAGGAVETPEAAAASVCRFCFSSDGELVSPCMCRGSNEWVHLECLRQWQKTVVLTQPTHPKYQTNIDTICNVCLEPFTGVGIPRSRDEQILEFVGGAEIAQLVQPGNLLVSTRESSRENLELITQHPEIKGQLMTWTKAVFLMLKTSPAEAKGGGHLIAVSMSQPIPGPPADARQGRAATRQWEELKTAQHIRVRHFDGGPIHRDAPIAIAHVPDAPAGSVQIVPPGWIFGDFEPIAALATKAAAASQRVRTVNVVWGCGGWGSTQVLAEIARGGWGLVSVPSFLALRPDANLEMDWELDFEWSRIVSIAKLPPRSEYTRTKQK